MDFLTIEMLRMAFCGSHFLKPWCPQGPGHNTRTSNAARALDSWVLNNCLAEDLVVCWTCTTPTAFTTAHVSSLVSMQRDQKRWFLVNNEKMQNSSDFNCRAFDLVRTSLSWTFYLKNTSSGLGFGQTYKPQTYQYHTNFQANLSALNFWKMMWNDTIFEVYPVGNSNK